MQTNDAWIDAFHNLGHKLVVSPYHDKDVNPDGSRKNRIIIFSYRAVVIRSNSGN